MRDASGQRADRFHLRGLTPAGVDDFPIRDVDDHSEGATRQPRGAILCEPGQRAQAKMSNASIRPDKPIFGMTLPIARWVEGLMNGLENSVAIGSVNQFNIALKG